MKDYFSHDYNSRNDPKMVHLQMKLGLEGIGVYWCIIEMLYESGGYLLQTQYERISFELRTKYDIVKSVIHDFDLFKFDNEKVWSESALERLNKRFNKSEQARQSIGKRWEKYERITDVKETNNEGNTNKDKDKRKKRDRKKPKSFIQEGETVEQFYQKELELSGNDSNYKFFIDLIFGRSNNGPRMNGILSLPYQLTFDDFQKLLTVCKAKNKRLTTLIQQLENKGYYKTVESIYWTLNTWLSKDE